MLNNMSNLEKSVSQISGQVKDKIFKSVKLSYKDVQDIVEIISEISELNDTIKKIECKETVAEFKRLVLHMSYTKPLHSFQYCQNKFLEFCRFQYLQAIKIHLISYNMRFEDFFNFYILYAIYHEMTHVMQDKLYSNKVNCDNNMTVIMNKSINFFDLPQNENFFKALSWLFTINKRSRLYREKYHSTFPIEREADIKGINLSADVFNQLGYKVIAKLKYKLSIHLLVDGYQNDKCPLEQVAEFIGFDYNQDLINETQKWNNYSKMIYGLPVEKSLISEGRSIIGDYSNSEMFIKKLTK